MCQYRESYIKMLKNLHIKQPEMVYNIYERSASSIMRLIERPNITNTNQKGGTKKIEYKFDNRTFILYEDKSDNGEYDISMHRNDDINDASYCLHITPDPIENIAVLQSISYYKDCVKSGLEHPGGGSILLKLCIKYLKENKNKYKIKRLILYDNSFYKCYKNKETIWLSLMHTLLFGHTWYGKYGFRPYNSNTKSLDIELNNNYENNFKIVTTTKMKDIDFSNYYYKINKDILPEKEAIEKKEEKKKYYKKYENLTIDKFFRKMLINFQDGCAFFSLFYRSFYTDMKLYNFKSMTFFLDL